MWRPEVNMKMSFLFEDGVPQPSLVSYQVPRTWPVSAPLGLGLQIFVTMPNLLLKSLFCYFFVSGCISCMCIYTTCDAQRDQKRALHPLFFFNLKNIVRCLVDLSLFLENETKVKFLKNK